jgi:hypothetical protein
VELTDPDGDALGWQFLNCAYVGDSSNIVLHRVMFGNGVIPHQGPAGGPSANGGIVSPRASRCPDDARPVTRRLTRSGDGGTG